MRPGDIGGDNEINDGRSQELVPHSVGAKVIRSAEGRAAECVLTIDEVDYRLVPIGTMVRVLAQEEIAKRRKALWQEAVQLAKDLPGETGKDLLLEAYRIQQRTVVTTIEESLAWLVSPEGDKFHFAMAIRKLQPTLTDTKISEIYDRATAAQLNLFREFQYLAYNPEGCESAIVACAYLEANPDLIPETIVEHVSALMAMAKRIV